MSRGLRAQVLRYETGQFYKVHHDQNSPRSSAWGPRMFTVFLYIGDGYEGGETHFPRLNLTVPAAKGRVWTGRQAKRRGLVDALGGTDEAVAIACAAAGLSAAVEVRPFPPAPTLAKVFESMGEEEEEGNGGNGGGSGGVGGAVGEVAAEAIEGAACAAAAAALRSTGLASLALALMHAEEAGAAVAAADGAQLMAEVPSV